MSLNPFRLAFSSGFLDLEDDLEIEGEQSFVICHPRAESWILNRCDLQSIALEFNGDDGVCLAYDQDNELVDCVGDLTSDPGRGWNVCGVIDATRDHTLRRKCSIRSGNDGDWTSSRGSNPTDCEWIVRSLHDGFRDCDDDNDDVVTENPETTTTNNSDDNNTSSSSSTSTVTIAVLVTILFVILIVAVTMMFLGYRITKSNSSSSVVVAIDDDDTRNIQDDAIEMRGTSI